MATRAQLLPFPPPSKRRRGSAASIAVIFAAAATILLWWRMQPATVMIGLAAMSLAGAMIAGAALLRTRTSSVEAPRDWTLLYAALADGADATIITDPKGTTVCVSPAVETLFGSARDPSDLPLSRADRARLAAGARVAMRDGQAKIDDLDLENGAIMCLLRRAGRREDHLVWRFRRSGPLNESSLVHAVLDGPGGKKLGAAGIMIALVNPDGTLVGANEVFLYRALGDAKLHDADTNMAGLLETGSDGGVRIARDPAEAPPLRIVPIALDEDSAEGPSVFVMFDEDPEAMTAAAARGAATVHLHELLAMLPLGLALVERDGRFLFLNHAFRRAAGLGAEEAAVYPSDLVADEDKSIVSDAVRRFAAGRALPGDLAVRLKHRPDDPVALTIANAKGLGDAAVLLSLKDNSEESKLKRQVAQATKMQAVGQLAGGVAHDFNNILTAIIGHCDLMMMRHTPGDIDYDDIQQIKHNSNRAASLTRQLLAFSRQQTLRPQILQLPDIISEISNLLRRLLGETVKLEVKHGRNLGLVRADPGQLEQVIVNLVVNARDAMPGGGIVTLETFRVSAVEVRRMRSDILPIADYTGLRVSDTGIGIPTEHLSKIFEPFFTTKEVGKGTGLGLSTVYGIVKQTDGFIFADSQVGSGTSFVIYLPIHHAAATPEPAVPVRVEPVGDTWGTGTILLVEDEAMVRAVAERALTRQGYQVLTATNGEEALELLQEGVEIDLLISDVVMPTMDGPTLVRTAREQFPNLKILFMSGYAEEQLRKSIDIDRVSFLPKPFSVQQLGQAARDAMLPPGPE